MLQAGDREGHRSVSITVRSPRYRASSWVAQAMSELVPRPDLGPCALVHRVAVNDPSACAFDLDRMESQLVLTSRIPDLFPSVPTVDELPTAPGALFRRFSSDAYAAKDLPPAEAKAKLAKWDLPNAFDWDVTIIKTQFDPTKAELAKDGKGRGKYTGGGVAGRAYVWSFAERRRSAPRTSPSKWPMD